MKSCARMVLKDELENLIYTHKEAFMPLVKINIRVINNRVVGVQSLSMSEMVVQTITDLKEVK